MREAVQNEALWFRVNEVVADKARERARSEGMSLSEYLREVVRRDVREAA